MSFTKGAAFVAIVSLMAASTAAQAASSAVAPSASRLALTPVSAVNVPVGVRIGAKRHGESKVAGTPLVLLLLAGAAAAGGIAAAASGSNKSTSP